MKVHRGGRRGRIAEGWGKLSLIVAGFAVIVTGCGGGGGGSSSTTTPSVSVDAAAVARPLSGTTPVTFRVVLNGTADGTVTADYATADGTAVAGTDYTATSGTVTFTPGQVSQTISVDVKALAAPAPAAANQTFSVTLSNVSANAHLGTATATGTIVNRQLDDTGVTKCATTLSNGATCPQPLYPRQDADLGRDAVVTSTSQKVGDGSAGFDFTMLDSSGNVITSGTPSCIRDNVTGLWWEVKATPGGGALQDANNLYTWYNPDNATNGGDAGTQGNGVSCTTLAYCDTYHYVNTINNGAGICGKHDWRLPTVDELRTIADFSKTSKPYLDTTYFPNTPTGPSGTPLAYWSATPSVDSANTGAYTWEVFFGPGAVSGGGSTLTVDSAFDVGIQTTASNLNYVRLVRTGN